MKPSRRRVVAALGVVQILAWGSSYYLLAVLAAPIAHDTGWPYPWVIGGLSVGLLVAGLVSIRVGRVIEAHGGCRVLATSALLLAAGLALMAAAPTLPVYLLAWTIIGAGMGAGLYDAAFATLGRLYGLEARRTITSLTLWGGFASTVCWPLSAWLVESLGWRGACLAYAALHLAVTLPLIVFVIPAASASATLPGAVNAEIGASERRPLFWILAATLTTAAVVAAVCSVHLITILEARGLTVAAAVALGALVGPAQVGARMVEFMAGGRHHPIWTLVAAAFLILVGLTVLWAGPTMSIVALIAYGGGAGLWSIARGALPLALFGARGYATLMGRLAVPSLVAQALAPTLGAVIISRFGVEALIGSLAALALATLAGVALLWTHAARSGSLRGI